MSISTIPTRSVSAGDPRLRFGLVILFLSLLCWLLFFHRLAERDLWSSHEARAGMDAQTILDDGVWGLPHLFDGRPEMQKPPLYYWLIASLAWLRGVRVDAWAVRLPAALSAALTVLAVFAGLAWGRRRPLAGLLAATTLATALHFTWLARIGRIDMPLTLSVTLAAGAFFLALGRTRWIRLLLLLSAYLAVAAGVLLKGPIALLLLIAVMTAHKLSKKDLRILRRQLISSPTRSVSEGRPRLRFGLVRIFRAAVIADCGLWWGIPLVAILVLPWYMWVNRHTHGEFFRVFLWHHNFERGWGGSHLRSNPWWFYLPQFFGDFLPWSPLVPLAVWWMYRRRLWREDDEARFGLAWFAAVFVLLSCSRFKRGDYLLPAYPGVAVFLGCVAEHWLRRLSEERRRRALRGIFAVAGVTIAVWIGRVEWWLPMREPYRDYRQFASHIRELAPRPDEVVLFRTEAHPLAFHLGRPLAIVVQWRELMARLSRPGTHYVVTPPKCAEQCLLYLPGFHLENVGSNTDLSERGHEHPLVLLRAAP